MTVAADGGDPTVPGDAGACPDAYPGSLFGFGCPAACAQGTCCDAVWVAQCAAQGGLFERCVYGGGCGSVNVGSTCLAPAMPGGGQFSCFDKVCDAGSICVHHGLRGDGCEEHHCDVPPSQCAGSPGCQCLLTAAASGSGGLVSNDVCGSGCTEDDAGNPTIDLCY